MVEPGKRWGPVDPKDQEILRSLVGRTIVAAVGYDTDSKAEWTEHEEFFLALDDGREVIFGAYGYDAWGATINISGAQDAAAG